jgi:predicted nucleotidyltransferase
LARIDASIAETIRKFLECLDSEGIRVEAAYLFGTFAEGTPNRWSDIDIAVVSPDVSEDRFEERVRLTSLSSSIDSRIEPVPFRPETFVDEDPLAWEIKRKGIRVDLEVNELASK